MADNFQKLQELLGTDLLKKAGPAASLLAEVQEEMKEERAKAAKEATRKALQEALALYERGNELKKNFDREYAKLDKEIGKIIGPLTGKPLKNEESTQENPQE